jgi:methylmalonyl-CoA mutase N-terminal domain/subunit
MCGAACGRCASAQGSAAHRINRRYRYLLEHGVNGLGVAFDLPTQMGYDSDHALAAGEVGKVGVAIDSVEDMAALFDGIPLDRVSTSMTINATAIVLLALAIAVARRRGLTGSADGPVRHDPERHPQECIARGTYIYPPRPSLRIVTDIVAYLRSRAAGLELDLDRAAITSAKRIDGGAGSRVHLRACDRVRAVGD